MKIAHVIAAFPPYHSGTGTVCYQNAVGMAQQGHQVDVFTSNYPAGTYNYPSEITVHRLPIMLRVGNAPLLPGLISGLRGYNVIHLHYPFIFGQELVYLLTRLRHMPFVITYHQDIILGGMIGAGVKIHETTIGRLILTRANRLLVTSLDYFQASRIYSFFQSRLNYVTEMPNGVNTTRFHPDQSDCDLRQVYGLADDDCVVLFVGGLDTPHYFKGVDVLLHSLTQLPASIKLMVVGDGDLRAHYTALAARLSISNRVIFCKRVPDEALPAHYAAADLLVLPSTTMGEAFGVVLLEAMATGKPVIASDLPGVRTVVDHGKDGLLVKPGDADDLAAKLATLAQNPDLRQSMGQQGRQKTEQKYDWAAITRRLETVYEDVIK